MILMAVSLVVAVAGISSSVKAETHLTNSPEDVALRQSYNKVWWGGMGTLGVAAAYQWFVVIKIQSIQKRIVELKNEIAAAEAAESQNVTEIDESTTDADGVVTSDEAELDTLESLQEELTQEEAKLASYKKKSYVAAAVVFAGLAAFYTANYKVTGNPLESWREIK
ncbi:MAG: hypothetical protein QG632_153 [Candidatus Dependentiae bacterium]|nr:hypothetical protein [Candidatus Dependentiae bacterium]